MSNDPRSDELKQKFRPDQSALDAEVDAALAEVSMDDLYGFNKPQSDQAARGGVGAGVRARVSIRSACRTGARRRESGSGDGRILLGRERMAIAAHRPCGRFEAARRAGKLPGRVA